MKKNLLLLLLVSSLFSLAQDGYVKGYIIDLKGDTIRGKIKDRKDIINSVAMSKIRFMDSTGYVTKYTADDIIEYCGLRGMHYKALLLGLDGRNIFVEVSESGEVILFIRRQGSSVIMSDLPNGTNKGVDIDYYLQKKTDVNSLMEWRKNDFKNTANYFFADDNELKKEIADGLYKFNDIKTIVKKYNDFKAKK